MSFRTFTKFKKRPTAPVARRGRRSAVTDALEDDIMQFRESLGVELARLQQSQALLDSEDEQPTQPRMRAGASTPCSRRTSYTRSSNLNTSNGNLATHLVVPDIRLSPPSEGDMARSVSTTCLMDSGVFDSGRKMKAASPSNSSGFWQRFAAASSGCRLFSPTPKTDISNL